MLTGWPGRTEMDGRWPGVAGFRVPSHSESGGVWWQRSGSGEKVPRWEEAAEGRGRGREHEDHWQGRPARGLGLGATVTWGRGMNSHQLRTRN